MITLREACNIVQVDLETDNCFIRNNCKDLGDFWVFDWGWKPGGRTEPIYNGFFVEPQVGWRVGRRSALALGLLIQQSTVSNHVTTENGTWGDPSYSIGEKVTTLNVFTPAVTIRYVVGF